MIIDKLENSGTYESIHPLFSRAFDTIKSIDVTKFVVGRQSLIGDELFVIMQQYETKPQEQGVWESHRKYIDIQYILEGEELINTASISDMTLGEYTEEKDFQQAEGVGAPTILREGEFAVFFPQDMHMPCLTIEKANTVKKIVCKVAVQN